MHSLLFLLSLLTLTFAQTILVNLYPLPEFGGKVDSQQVTIGIDHYFGPISDNNVGSINVTQSGYVCLLYGGYANGDCIEANDEFQCTMGDEPHLKQNDFSCMRCLGPGDACP
ncbi:hypothetical protein BDD12DRAFT_893885 [Trichophaea hybrida]|nr:hypothetical protein BDD12DRAFT_893885 [Trichophaea hybrida]